MEHAVTNQLQIIGEWLPPTPPFPGYRPTGRSGVFALDRLGDHLRFLDRPGGHRLAPAGVLGDHGLEYDQSQAGLGGFLDLHAIERELPGCLAPWIAQR